MGVGHLRYLPLSAAAFGACDARCVPRAPDIPSTVSGFGRQIGEEEPRLGMLRVSPDQHGTRKLTVPVFETGATQSAWASIGGNQVAQPHPRRTSGRTNLHPRSDAHQRMLAQLDYLPNEPAGIQSAIDQHKHRPVL